MTCQCTEKARAAVFLIAQAIIISVNVFAFGLSGCKWNGCPPSSDYSFLKLRRLLGVQKICLTYFEIGQTYFKIPRTYFSVGAGQPENHCSSALRGCMFIHPRAACGGAWPKGVSVSQ